MQVHATLPVLSVAAAMIMLHCQLPRTFVPETAGGTASGKLSGCALSAVHKHFNLKVSPMIILLEPGAPET
jgi:hypothetical protein